MTGKDVEKSQGSKPQAPLVESKSINRLLLKNARRSAEEIEAITGIPATEVAERLTKLLANPSWRDDLMEEKLVLEEIGILIDEIRDRMSRWMTDEDWINGAKVQLQAFKIVLDQLTTRRKHVDGQLAVVTKMQAELMAVAIRLATEQSYIDLQKRFGIEYEDAKEVFDANLAKAVEYLEAKADESEQ